MRDDSRAIILVVDDIPDNRNVLGELLRSRYRVRTATTGKTGLRLALGDPRPDLILLDVALPDIDGHQVFAGLRANPQTADIPVIFVAARNTVDEQVRGLQAGAADYISKPIVPALVLARVRAHLERKLARDRMLDQNRWLEAEVGRRLAENELIQTVGICALAHMMEARDPETGNHILRTQSYVHELACLLRALPEYADQLGNDYVELLARSAPLHDIGKVGIPDQILRKPGSLTPEEWTVMKTHARLGADAIELAKRDAQRPVAFLSLAQEIARWHHERWDGTGYPDGLRGAAIPLSARLMALADVFDAVISPRSYKTPISFEKARRIITDGCGSHFDPAMVAVFDAAYERFVAIALRHRDEP